MSASSPAQPYTQSTPQAHIIASDAEALAIAHEIAAVLKPGAAERDRTGIVPAEIVNTYSNRGLWGITVPRRFAPPLVRELLARPEKEVLGLA